MTDISVKIESAKIESCKIKSCKIESSLAPMAGYTDSVFRRLCSKMGASYTVSEMISAVALTYNDRKTAELARIESDDEKCVLQIFGHDPSIMAKAAEILLSGSFNSRYYAAPPLGIDINMGCPVKKIFSSGDGSALMANESLAAEITERCAEVCARHGVPLSVKIRLGTDGEHINAPHFAAAMANAGASKITLHTRTRAQMYSPSANPSYCAAVRHELDSTGKNVLLCGNGDIVSRESGEEYFRCGCDEIAVGRGALGNPWIFRELTEGDAYIPPSVEEIIETSIKLVEDIVQLKGEVAGIRESRSRAAYFIKGIRGAAAVRDELNHAESLAQFTESLKKLTADSKQLT